jgi:hypothetical protein
MRHTIGFHVDQGLMRKGLKLACEEDRRTVILAGDGPMEGTTSFRLGLELLVKGTGFTLAEFEAVLTAVRDDSGAFGTLVQNVFIHLLKEIGR